VAPSPRVEDLAISLDEDGLEVVAVEEVVVVVVVVIVVEGNLERILEAKSARSFSKDALIKSKSTFDELEESDPGFL